MKKKKKNTNYFQMLSSKKGSMQEVSGRKKEARPKKTDK
jgi:hypothetical protein